MSYKVIDNFLSPEEHKRIYDLFLTSYTFPWYYNPSVVNPYGQDKETEFQFIHFFSKDGKVSSEYFEFVVPILEKLNADLVFRIKANLSTRTATNIESGYHVDGFENCKTVVYYVNSNDGYTKFENGDIVESLENRLLIFDSDMLHTGASCTNEKVRSVINFNITQKI